MIQIDGEDIVFIDSLGRTLRLTREKVERLIEEDLEDAAAKSLKYAEDIHG